jgi:hypothetical protein
MYSKKSLREGVIAKNKCRKENFRRLFGFCSKPVMNRDQL